MGFVNFYSKYSEKFADATAPLLSLLRKGKKYCWTEFHQKAFDAVKKLFIKEAVLYYPNKNKEYNLSCDASNIALGAVLSQKDDNGNEKIITCISRTLKGAEIGYFVSEREMLSIVWALKKLNTYICGAKIIIRSDHQALTFFKKCNYTNARLQRWMLALQDYDIDIVYVKGKNNLSADLFSRRYDESFEPILDKEILISSVLYKNPDSKIINDIKNIKQLQKQDQKINKIIDKIKNEIDEKLMKKYVIVNDLLYKISGRYKLIVISDSFAISLINQIHQMYAHISAVKIIKMIKEEFYNKGLKKKTYEIVHTCEVCQKTKHYNQSMKVPLGTIKVERINQLVSIDFFGCLPQGRGGVKFLLVCIDAFSKHIQLYSIKKATTEVVINKIFNHYIPTYGKMQSTVSTTDRSSGAPIGQTS